jgi:hypothetical protein
MIYGIGIKNDVSTIAAAAEGYWVFLKALPKGEYALNCEGSCENGRVNLSANYQLKIK